MKSRDPKLPKLFAPILDVVSAGVSVVAQHHLVRKGFEPTAVEALASAAQAAVVRLAERYCEDPNYAATYLQQRNAAFFAEVGLQLPKIWEFVHRTAQNAITPEEAFALIEQYRDHAARSVREERVKYLAAAAAATFRPDLDVEMLSRGERAMATLEPSDIEALRSLRKLLGMEAYAESGRHAEARVLFEGLPLTNQIALEQSGCVITTKEAPSNWGLPTPVVTPLGATVLKLVETYKRDESGQAEQAGGAG